LRLLVASHRLLDVAHVPAGRVVVHRWRCQRGRSSIPCPDVLLESFITQTYK
jgi:hypothetical protein